MGTGDILLGGNPAMDLHLIQGGVAILLGLLHATETGNKLRPCGPLVRVRLYLYLWYAQGALAQYLRALFGQKENFTVYFSRKMRSFSSIQTRHNDLFFSNCNLFQGKLKEELARKTRVN